MVGNSAPVAVGLDMVRLLHRCRGAGDSCQDLTDLFGRIVHHRVTGFVADLRKVLGHIFDGQTPVEVSRRPADEPS